MIGTKRRKEYLTRLSFEYPNLVKVYKKYVKRDANIDFYSYAEFVRTIKDWAEIENNLEKQDA